MKEYIFEAEHSWETQRRPVIVDHHNHQRHQHQPNHRQRHLGGDDAAMDADASSMSGMYNDLYSVASFSVYLKFRIKKKIEARSAVLYIYTSIVLLSLVTHIYMS